jgi:hypothetical protein
MKAKLFITFLIAVTLLYSCERKIGGCADNLQILFNLHGSEIDSLHFLLNNSSHTDTCFVKGILGLFDYDIQCCMIVQPAIIVNKIEDFYFKQ